MNILQYFKSIFSLSIRREQNNTKITVIKTETTVKSNGIKTSAALYLGIRTHNIHSFLSRVTHNKHLLCVVNIFCSVQMLAL